MQIPPSSSLLQALSGSPTQTASQARAPRQSDAAREAARAVFAQLKQPVAAVTAAAPQTASATQITAAPQLQALPSTPPTRPMPRGSLLNILV